MKLEFVRTETYRLPLYEPYQHGDQLVATRDIVLVFAKLGSATLVAELGPFPGINTEGLPAAAAELLATFGSSLDLPPNQ